MSLKIYKSERAAIGLVLVAVGGVGIVVGMSLPLLTLLLERGGFGASLIGINSATGSLGILAVGLFSARILGRHGAYGAIIVAMMLGAGSLIALPLVNHVAGWFILRFLLAIGVGFLWLLSESWLNMLSDDQNRGRIIGLYAVAFSSGFAIGPLIVAATGSQGLLPFAIVAAAMICSALPMLILADRAAPQGHQVIRMTGLFWLAPFVFIVGFAGGLFEMTAYTLLPIYTLSEGLSETASLYALSAFSAGGIGLQYPLGRLADFAGRQALLMLNTTGILACLVALPYAITESVLLIPLLFVWGGMVFGLYTTGLIMLGDKFRAGDLVAANALFIISFESGAVFGPALSGGAMDLWPDHGFVRFLLAMAVLLMATILYRNVRRRSVIPKN